MIEALDGSRGRLPPDRSEHRGEVDKDDVMTARFRTTDYGTELVPKSG